MTQITNQLSNSGSPVFSTPESKPVVTPSKISHSLLTASPEISEELKEKWVNKIEQFKINHRNLDNPAEQKKYHKQMDRLEFKMMFFRHALDLLEAETKGNPREALWEVKEDLQMKLKPKEKRILKYKHSLLSIRVKRIESYASQMDINKFGKSLLKHQRKIAQYQDINPDKAQRYIERQMEKIRNKVVELDAKIDETQNKKETIVGPLLPVIAWFNLVKIFR